MNPHARPPFKTIVPCSSLLFCRRPHCCVCASNRLSSSSTPSTFLASERTCRTRVISPWRSTNSSRSSPTCWCRVRRAPKRSARTRRCLRSTSRCSFPSSRRVWSQSFTERGSGGGRVRFSRWLSARHWCCCVSSALFPVLRCPSCLGTFCSFLPVWIRCSVSGLACPELKEEGGASENGGLSLSLSDMCMIVNMCWMQFRVDGKEMDSEKVLESCVCEMSMYYCAACEE